jgi:hypothetical protein
MPTPMILMIRGGPGLAGNRRAVQYLEVPDFQEVITRSVVCQKGPSVLEKVGSGRSDAKTDLYLLLTQPQLTRETGGRVALSTTIC